MRARGLLFALFVGVSAIACSVAPEDDDAVTSEGDELRSLSPSEILGTLAYGQTSDPVAYTKTPLYRAFRFEGKKGDHVEAWVRSSDGGDARAWLLRGTFGTLASNLDASPGVKDARVEATLTESGTHYVVFRDTAGASRTFTVSLAKLGGTCDLPMVEVPTWEAAAGAPLGYVLFDTKRGRLVSLTPEGTSELAPGGWTPPTGDPIPGGLRDHTALAYDSARGKVVLFGGRDVAYQPFGDTWEWDSATGTWTESSPPGLRPRARSGHALAYDAARGRVVLYGGQAGPGELMSDTWTWDGATWERVGTASSPHPPPVYGGAMAFDEARGRTVFYGRSGGYNVGRIGEPNTAPTETWEWDGATWLAGPQSSRGYVSSGGPSTLPMVYDAQRGAVVRIEPTGPQYQQSFVVRAWDGKSWLDVTGGAKGPAVDIASATQYGTAYDRSRSRLHVSRTSHPRNAHEFFVFEQPNRAPQLAAIAPQRVFAGDELRVTLAGSDPDRHELRYHVANLPAAASLDEKTGVLTWRPNVGDVGTHDLVAEVTDGCASASRPFSITVDHLAYASLPAGDVALSGNVSLDVDVRRLEDGLSTRAYPKIACTVAGSNPGKVTVTCSAGTTRVSWNNGTSTFVLPPIWAPVESDLTFAYRELPNDLGRSRVLTGSLEPLVDGTYKLHVTGYAQIDESNRFRVVNRVVAAGVVDVP